MQEPLTEGYKGVFKGISENLNRPVGKMMPANNLAMKQHHYNIGYAPWQQTYQSIYGLHHDPKEVPKEKINIAKQGRSQVDLGQYRPPGNDHFKSEAGKQYAGLQNKERTKPVYDKSKILAAQIVLGNHAEQSVGNEQPHYKTVSQINHGDNLQLPKADEIKYKSKPLRYDIITNKEVPVERLRNACQFDYWNEERSKRHVSANHAQFPTGKLGRIDPITNRVIVK